MKAQTLQVPGATLYYEVRGSGPVLLMIPGGNGDAGLYERVADALADRYTVVSYDRRGFSRSLLDGPVDDGRRLEIDSEDARRLLDHLADGPAHVFGSSSGAIVVLDLVIRDADRIGTLVAHEPPMLTLLPDAAQLLEFLDGVYDTYRRVGADAAMQEFFAGAGLEGLLAPPPGGEHPAPVAEMVARVRGNFEFALEHEIRQYPRFVPDVAALEAVSARLVLAGGHDSRELFPYRPNTVLAERLGIEVVDFPGGHVGYLTHPAEFAPRLGEVLG